MNNLKGLTPKVTVYEGIFNEKWEATISFGRGTSGTIVIPKYNDLRYTTAIGIGAAEDDKFTVYSINSIPLLTYKVNSQTGDIYSAKHFELDWSATINSDHYVSTQAINPKTGMVCTVTFTLKRGEGKNFTLTLIED